MAAPAVQPSRGTGAGEAAGTGPEMAVRRRRRRRFLLVGAASAALLLGAGVVTLSKRPPAPAAPSVPSPSSEPAASIAAQAAEDELKRGDPQAAIALLRAQGATRIADDASAQLQLGHAHAARREYRQATSAYQRALELDPALHGNQELRTNLELMLASDEGTIALGAAEVMLRQLAAPSASERLVALAERHPNASTRRRALELADELGLGERVNRVASFILDLQTSPTCLARKQAVAKLRALGDPAAIPALAQAAKIPPRPKIRKGRKRPPPVRDPYACLHKDARDAMLYLQRLDGRPPAAAPR
jgi:tetratricopeptide (TPR) repeat protein